MALIEQAILGDLNDTEILAAAKDALNPFVLSQRLNIEIDENTERSHKRTLIPLESEAMVFRHAIHLML
ncbi:hypothetical protein OAM00_01820 [Verrucomicrobia bacterium]|nr:hypothetical protein [Verrucomicrobiota bacterium]MDA7620649.1 hypothetical protein [Verrucomicrobiota bacterium]MDC0299498.1 hypothetical protein [Verrucomicrobiota bacterium]MDC0323901.1 hypothetical protein [Verrucomicrobiota bacterium]